MRTCKGAKAMAKQLRHSLAARSVSLSHSECLDIVAKQFGFADWNTLSANLNSQSSLRPSPEPLSCSFCGKSQHEVRSLIEGGCSKRGISPCVFICDECVAFSAQINTDIGDLADLSDLK
jgi:hypothetical protein